MSFHSFLNGEEEKWRLKEERFNVNGNNCHKNTRTVSVEEGNFLKSGQCQTHTQTHI
jgi:hypothetical protein